VAACTPVIELTVDQAVDRAAMLARRGRTLLGIVGCPGAGKSTLSDALVSRLPSTVVVPMDGFHMLNEELVRLGRRDRKGAPDTFDAPAFVALLERIRHQAAGAPVPDAITVEPDVSLVITEGNYLLLDHQPWDAVKPLLDEVWYVDIDSAERVPRLIARHIEFGKSPEEAREWVMRSDEANAAVVAASRNRADVVVRLS
jgi:pantothenate kinase